MLIVSVLLTVVFDFLSFPFTFAIKSYCKQPQHLHCRESFQQRAMSISYSFRISLKLTMGSLGSTDSNRAVNIFLVTSGLGGLRTLHSFHPAFTYAIFGQEERIFGYQGLNITLRYNACDMRPSLQILYNRKFKTVGETSATDLKAVLEGYLPKSKYILVV